jgi:hypothetical protein
MSQASQSDWNNDRVVIRKTKRYRRRQQHGEPKWWQLSDIGLPERLIVQPVEWKTSPDYTEEYTQATPEPGRGLPPLSSLLDQLRAHKPLVRSESLINLAREVIHSQNARRAEDIDAWAQRIADDVADRTD